MSSNQATLAPINVTQPSTVGKGRVDLVKSDFDAIIATKGYDVYLDKAVRCPCRRISDSQALSSCRNCGGSGYVFINRYKTKMVIQSMNVDTKFKEWSEEKLGNARITARDEEKLGFMDRITLIGSETTTSQVIFPKIISGGLKGKLIYNPISIDEIFCFVSDKDKLYKMEVNTDYTISNNVLTFDNKFTSWNDFTVTVRYRHEPSYHVIDLVREVMNTVIKQGGQDKRVVMPISAVARKAHYVIDEQNMSGDYLNDNSYAQTGCGATNEVLVHKPTLLRLSHPNSTTIVLNWQDNSSTETNYVVERSGIDGVWSSIAVLSPNITTYSDTVLANTTYFYRVAARQGTKQSEWTDSVGVTTNA